MRRERKTLVDDALAGKSNAAGTCAASPSQARPDGKGRCQLALLASDPARCARDVWKRQKRQSDWMQRFESCSLSFMMAKTAK